MDFFGDFFERFVLRLFRLFLIFFVFLCMDCLLCNSSARFHKIEKPKFNTTPCLGLADIIKLLGSLLVSGDVCSTYGGGVHRQSDYCPGDWHAACAPVIAWIQFSGESPFAWSSAVMTLTPSKSDFFFADAWHIEWNIKTF